MSEESIGQVLSQICRLNHRTMHTLLETLGLYRGQPLVLRALWEHEGLTHSELAECLHVQPATMSNMVRRMENAGFVERRPDLHDHRVSRVFLTDAGRAIRDQVRQVWMELEAQAFGHFEEPERALLRGLLLRVRDNLLQAYGETLHQAK